MDKRDNFTIEPIKGAFRMTYSKPYDFGLRKSHQVRYSHELSLQNVRRRYPKQLVIVVVLLK